LAAHIKACIVAAGGWISFAEYMRLALYAPGLGYYAAGSYKLGAAGDFITAPEISPLFGAAVAAQVAEVLRLGGGEVLELGPGSGRLAADLLTELARLGTVPERYLLLEPSPDLRARQQAQLARLPPELSRRCIWLEALPGSFAGVVLGNEVLDALPVERVKREGGRSWQQGVALTPQGDFAWAERPLEQGDLHAATLARLPEGPYLGEINFQAEALLRSLGAMLARGLVLFFDYGYPAAEYYHPQRHQGTLSCFYRHHTHEDPFHLPGLQDLTAHVDFTAIALAAAESGLELAGYATQAWFLLNCGILDALANQGQPGTTERLKASNAVNRLLHPAEMGELFKVIAWTRALELAPLGFRQGNQLFRL
jgi:SAM-dependent MidA family methyltransferase